jgi:tetratricopeptide (TPR) repeat protein
MQDWAREQYNLGNACCELPQDSFPDKWEQAIEHYTDALRVRTSATHPEGHARILENLGTAYRELLAGDRLTNLLHSLRCYREALRVYRPASFPRENGAVHNNLGNTFLSLAQADHRRGVRHAQRAVLHFAQALRYRSQNLSPGDYAITQFNRAQALLWLATEGPELEPYLHQSEACFREASRNFRISGQVELATWAEQRLVLIAQCLEAKEHDVPAPSELYIEPAGDPPRAQRPAA